MSPPLPVCELRESIPNDHRLYCRHSEIKAPLDLVTPLVCRVCPVREKPDVKPRRELAETELRERVQQVITMPSVSIRLWNVAAALRDFVADGLKTVDPDQYARRLEVCESCVYREQDRCSICGCNLTMKARGRAFQCPHGLWPS